MSSREKFQLSRPKRTLLALNWPALDDDFEILALGAGLKKAGQKEAGQIKDRKTS